MRNFLSPRFAEPFPEQRQACGTGKCAWCISIHVTAGKIRRFVPRCARRGLFAAGRTSGRKKGSTLTAGVKSVLQALRLREDVNLPLTSIYSFRHKVTTVLHQASVSEDQVNQMLGHRRATLRTTGGYGEWNPDYPKGAAVAIDG